MEARVAKLEATVEHIYKDVSDLRDDSKEVRDRLRALEVKVDHLPGKGFIVAALLLVLTAIAALIGFAESIQSFLSGS